MVGTRDRVPLGIGLSSEISAGSMPAGAPHAFLSVIPRYPVFKVPGAPSAPPRRFLPSAAQRDILRAPPPAVKGLSRLFPGKGRLMGRFRRTTWGDALLVPFVPRTHSLHKPRKGAGRRCGHLDVRRREPTKCSRARLTKRARFLGTPSNCRAESFEAKSAEGVGASLYIVALRHAEIFPAL